MNANRTGGVAVRQTTFVVTEGRGGERPGPRGPEAGLYHKAGAAPPLLSAFSEVQVRRRNNKRAGEGGASRWTGGGGKREGGARRTARRLEIASPLPPTQLRRRPPQTKRGARRCRTLADGGGRPRALGAQRGSPRAGEGPATSPPPGAQQTRVVAGPAARPGVGVPMSPGPWVAPGGAGPEGAPAGRVEHRLNEICLCGKPDLTWRFSE